MGYSIARVTRSTVSKVVASSHDDGEQSFRHGFWRNRVPPLIDGHFQHFTCGFL